MHSCIKRMPSMLATLLISAMICLFCTLLVTPQAKADELFSICDIISETVNDSIEAAKHEYLLEASHDGDFYFAQEGSGRCTITSIAMMVRRAAFIDDNEAWQSISAASATADGWTSAGVKNSFTTAGYAINYVSISNDHDSLVQLLEEHPEGIAAYDPGVPHAVLLTDYDADTDTFYCADPAGYYSGARIPLSDSWNGARRGGQSGVIAGFTSAWIIA